MSASASKKKRQALDEQGLNQSQIAANKEKEEKKKKRLPIIIFCIVAAIAVALIIVLALVGKSQSDARIAKAIEPDYDVSMVAATVGDESITVPIYNYFYNQTANSNAQMAMYFYGLQTDIPFAEQTYGDGTFEDYFIQQTNTTVSQYLNLYAAAKEAGYTLTDEDKAAIDESLKGLADSAKSYGYPSTDYYLYLLMGSGCTEENYREYLELYHIVDRYVADERAKLAPTEDAITAEYAENPNAYDYVNYSVYTVTTDYEDVEVEGDEENPEPHTEHVFSDEALAASKAAAEAAEKSFPTEDVTSRYGNEESLGMYLSEDAVAWLLESERKEGDVKAFYDEETHAYSVVRYDYRDTNEYNRVKAYVVPISVSSSEGTADNAASAENIAKKIQSGMTQDMTDEAFEQLVTDNGYTASVSTVAKFSYDQAIVDYLYSADRKAGDFTLIQVGETWYVVRFLSVNEELFQHELVKNALTEAAEDAWFEEMYSRNEIEVNEEALTHAKTNLTLYSGSNS